MNYVDLPTREALEDDTILLLTKSVELETALDTLVDDEELNVALEEELDTVVKLRCFRGHSRKLRDFIAVSGE